MDRSKSSNSLASGLYWRGNIIWYTIRFNGRQFKASCKTNKFDKALRCRNIKLGELARGEVGGSNDPSAIRIGELLDDLLTHADKKLKPQTAKIYRYSVDANIRPFFEKIKASKLTTKHTEDYRAMRIRDLTATKKRNDFGQRSFHATVNRELTLLRRALSLGMKRTPRKVSFIPVFDRVSEKANVRQGLLSEAHYRLLLDELPEFLKPLFVVASHVGIRDSELLKVKWPQVDFEDRMIRLNPWETKKEDIRTCPFLGDMDEHLRVAKAHRDEFFPKCPWVFSREGQRITDFRGSWASAIRRVALKVGGDEKARVENLRFHDLRRTAKVRMDDAGIPEAIQMSIMGHRTNSMSIRYNIVNLSRLKDAQAKYDAEWQQRKISGAASMASGPAGLAQQILARQKRSGVS